MEEKLKVDTFMKVICVFFPLVGWMLYAINSAESPNSARECMVWSLGGFGIGFFLVFCYFLYIL